MMREVLSGTFKSGKVNFIKTNIKTDLLKKLKKKLKKKFVIKE
jgi:hypothetical protein